MHQNANKAYKLYSKSGVVPFWLQVRVFVPLIAASKSLVVECSVNID
jgi:hypothetical protein